MESKTFVAAISDVYGVEHPAAVCFVSNATRNVNMAFDQNAANGTQNIYSSYQVRFWHDAAAKADGARTQDVLSKSGVISFVVPSKGDELIADFIDICAAHFIENVAPKLNEM